MVGGFRHELRSTGLHEHVRRFVASFTRSFALRSFRSPAAMGARALKGEGSALAADCGFIFAATWLRLRSGVARVEGSVAADCLSTACA